MWKFIIIGLLEFCAEILTKQVTGRYECGEHGKFEYCLEGVPACVIGCHCHPGYYFDTETKVCEPNNRLAQNYRKQNTDLNVWPTRVSDQEFTTASNINEKLNDDLGDWLYNQFFKTVENQVLNETSKDPENPSRRSNDVKTPPSRRSKKGKEKKKTRKHKSRKDRRRKLLRIPSDDPMWETSGESESDSSSSSKSNSGSSSESGSASNEKKKPSKDKGGKSDRKKSDHDHSKFLIIKKNPKPPLPSFIFLPNMDTPYYPPVGIAAAAAMPMFPMVPVPPMMPYPAPGPMPGADPVSTAGPGGIEGNPVPETPESTTVAVTVSTEPSEDTPTEGKDEEKDDPPETDDKKIDDDVVDPKNITRLGARIRKKMKRARHERLRPAQLSRRHHLKAPLPLPIQTNFPVPTLNEGNIKEGNNKLRPTIQVIQASSKPYPRFQPQQILQQNPDKLESIKYLSQFIRKTHGLQNEKPEPQLKGDFNNMILQKIENQLRILQDPPEEKLKRNNQLLNRISNHLSQILAPKKQELQPSRRMFNNEELNADEGDAYYANLGRQIASVIKDVYPGNVPDSTPQSPPVFNENSYSSRSFWERAVRSPTTHKALSEITTKQSLYDLENRVKYAATDVPFLSLSEIENIINMVNGDNNKRNDVHIHVSHTVHNTTRIMNLELFPKNSLKKVDIKNETDNNINKEHNVHKHLPKVPHPLTKYSIFKSLDLGKHNIGTTPKDSYNKSNEMSHKSHQRSKSNSFHNKHRGHHHTHHHDHNHLMPGHQTDHNTIDSSKPNHTLPDDIDHHKIYEDLDNKEERNSNHDETHPDKSNQFYTHENNNKKAVLEPNMNFITDSTVNPETTAQINDIIKPDGYNIDAHVINHSSKSNHSRDDNSNYKQNNLQNRKLYANIDEYVNVNPIANSKLNPKKFHSEEKIEESYLYPKLNRHESKNENVYLYPEENPEKRIIENKRIREFEPIYPSIISSITKNINVIPNEQPEAQNTYPNINVVANNFNIPDENSKFQNMFPNLKRHNENKKYSHNKHESSLNTDINPIINIEIPTNYELNTSNTSRHGGHHHSRHDVGVRPNNANQQNNRRTIITNGTDSYVNYLPTPYADLTYNIDTRRQLHPAYPYIFKGTRPNNQNKPIWTGFPGRGFRPFKKPQTPIFRSALFFDDFN